MTTTPPSNHSKRAIARAARKAEARGWEERLWHAIRQRDPRATRHAPGRAPKHPTDPLGV